MSETKKRKGNAAIACGDVKTNEDNKGIIIEQGTYSPSKNEVNQLAGMEIIAYDNKVTNELGEPVSRIDENGKKFNVEAKYTSAGKKLEAKDKQEKGQDR